MDHGHASKSQLNPDSSKEVDDIAGLISFATTLKETWGVSTLIFRGQGNHTWGLMTSLERAFERWSIEEPSDKSSVERFLVKEFIRRAHHYIKRPPSFRTDVDTLEWLSHMQHYGAPTRLLDWSYSPYYAVFMAIDSLTFNGSESADCSIWLTDPKWCRDRSNDAYSRCTGQTIHGDLLEHGKDELAKSRKRRIQNFRTYFWEHKVRAVYPANGFRLNDRVSVQQGLFLCPGDVTVGFEDNWKALNDSGHTSQARLAVCRLKTSKPEVRDRLISDLLRMGINRTQVYPGLEGFAKSLDLRIPLWKELL